MNTSVSDSPQQKSQKSLTLAEQIKVIERKEKGESTKSIAAAFCTALTQIVNILSFVEYMKGLVDDIQRQRLRKRTIES